MLEKLNNILNIVMGSSIGVFIGHAVYVYFDYRKYPDLYAIQSAPWYASIMTYGLCTTFILLVAMILKVLIKKKLKKDSVDR